VIISVIAVQIMQAPIMDEIDVGAVLHAHVLLTGMAVGVIVARHPRDKFLTLGIGGADFERVFIDMAIMPMVEMAVVKVIDMAPVLERLMPTSPAMLVIVSRVQHLVGGERRCEQGQRENRAKQGSMHDDILHKTMIPRVPYPTPASASPEKSFLH
jgi:hypothetical protein